MRDTEHVNTTIAKAYQNEQGQIVTVADAELFFTFLTESCWYQNVVGYYYYKTGECPAAPDQVKKIVIFPNASIKGNVPYLNWYDKVPGGATNYGSRNAPLETNRKVQLLFPPNFRQGIPSATLLLLTVLNVVVKAMTVSLIQIRVSFILMKSGIRTIKVRKPALSLFQPKGVLWSMA